MPARLSACSAAPTGAMPYNGGSTAATAFDAMRARGVRPSASHAVSDASRRAAAPSLSGDAFPAETVPSGRKAGRRRASASIEVSGRMDSSRSNGAAGTATTSSAKRPASHAAVAWR